MADIITTLQNKNGDNLYPLAGGMIDDSITTAMLKDNVVTPAKTNFKGQSLDAGDLELYGSTPLIDFHYADASGNYTSRIIADSATSLNILPGSAGGLKVNSAPVETVLYNNTSGSNNTITLSASAANFNYLKIFFRDNDSQYGYVEVHSPNGKRVGLHTSTSAGGSNGFIKTRDISISGTSISTYGSTQYAQMTINHNGSSSIAKSNYIYITRVVGGYYA